jgi:succinyl-diaminopimelate desuccinylase
MNPSPTLDLALELLRRPSITPDDQGCLDVIQTALAPIGFVFERFDHEGVCNLWARRGSTAPLVVLAGHTDVVPPGPAWESPPFEPDIRDGKLYARGAADMKTSLAAFVTAVQGFVGDFPDHPGSIAFLLTSDEEGVATHGTVAVVNALAKRGERIDYCIVGEPTSTERLGDCVKNGRRGSLSGCLKVNGIQGHVAYPERVRNPIHLLAPALAELVAQRWDEGNAFFPPTSFQVSNLHSGTGATNVVPGEATLWFNFRFSTASTPEALKARVLGVLDRHGLDYTVDWTLSGMPFLTEKGRLLDALKHAIVTLTGRPPELSTSGGTSDGRFIAQICPEVVECGPVNASIHKVNEWVELDAIEALSTLYRHTLEQLLMPSKDAHG